MDIPPSNTDTIIAARHRIRQEALGAAWIIAEEMSNPTAHMLALNLRCIRRGVIDVIRDQMQVPQEQAIAEADILIHEVVGNVMENMRKSDFAAQTPDAREAKGAALSMFRHELEEQRAGAGGRGRGFDVSKR